MKKNILFSIIVPMYNSEKYILDTVNSVLNQDYSNFELLLIDDGSTDMTYNLLQSILIQDKRVKYYKKDNSGAAESRNYGLKYSKGDYVFFLDSDDLIESNLLSFLICEIKKKKFDIYVFGYDNFYENNNFFKKYLPSTKKSEYYYDEIKEELIPYMITNIKNESDIYVHFNRMMLINKELILKLKWSFLSERIYLSEDVVSLIDLFYNSNSVKIIYKVFYHYRVNEKSLTHKYDNDFNLKNNNMFDYLYDLCINKYNERYVERIIYLFFSYSIVNIKSIVHSNLSFNKKIFEINCIINNKKIQYLLDKYLYLNSFKRKLFLSLFKLKKKYLIYLFALIN